MGICIMDIIWWTLCPIVLFVCNIVWADRKKTVGKSQHFVYFFCPTRDELERFVELLKGPQLAPTQANGRLQDVTGYSYIQGRCVLIQRYFCKGYDYGEKHILARPTGI